MRKWKVLAFSDNNGDNTDNITIKSLLYGNIEILMQKHREQTFLYTIYVQSMFNRKYRKSFAKRLQ